MSISLLFDPDNWGQLLVDAVGNIAVTDEPFRVAQDVATAVQTFKSDLWYYADEGVPYLEQIYGEKPNLVVLADYLEQQALRVVGVTTAKANIVSFIDRELSGQIVVNDEFGVNL